MRLHRSPVLLTVAALAATAIGTVAIAPRRATAASNAVPTYEVKLDLGSSALSNGAPTSAVLSTFGLSDPEQRSYEYLDTNALDLNSYSWDVRVRHEAGGDIEYTYKRRFPVANGDVDAALDDANDAGFDSSDTNYDAEVDWGYSKQTLSFSDTKDESAKGLSGTSLPSDAVQTATKDVPGKLDDETNGKNWGGDTLASSRVHGPVTGTVWSGTWEGADASIEVVTIGSQTVTELSFKVDDESTAAKIHSDAIAATDGKGWLLHEDILKTNLVLTSY